jgi:hypothetical protein
MKLNKTDKTGLKILFPATGVWVQLPSRVLKCKAL